MALSGLGSVALDFAFEKLFGDGCYSLRDAVNAFSIGAFAGGGGFAVTGVKRIGKEFSHTVPKRVLKGSPRGTNRKTLRDTLVSYGKKFERSRYRTLNGNFVRPRTHAKTDYHRRLKGMRANDMWPQPVRGIVRTPAWMFGGLAGLAVPNCSCQE